MTMPASSISLSDATTDLLSALGKGERGIICAIAAAQNPQQSALLARLEELGFVVGEHVRVVAVAFPAGDPIAVRIGHTTFALRRHEAQMIYVDRQ